jgi:hypothetical protein
MCYLDGLVELFVLASYMGKLSLWGIEASLSELASNTVHCGVSAIKLQSSSVILPLAS